MAEEAKAAAAKPATSAAAPEASDATPAAPIFGRLTLIITGACVTLATSVTLYMQISRADMSRLLELSALVASASGGSPTAQMALARRLETMAESAKSDHGSQRQFLMLAYKWFSVAAREYAEKEPAAHGAAPAAHGADARGPATPAHDAHDKGGHEESAHGKDAHEAEKPPAERAAEFVARISKVDRSDASAQEQLDALYLAYKWTALAEGKEEGASAMLRERLLRFKHLGDPGHILKEAAAVYAAAAHLRNEKAGWRFSAVEMGCAEELVARYAAALAPADAAHASAHGGEHAPAPHWAYEGDYGPANWGLLAPDARGDRQSPINIEPSGAVVAANLHLRMDYHPCKLTLINNGHTIQADVRAVERNSTMEIGMGGVTNRYLLKQFHFHHRSEHQLDGVDAPLEVHLVHELMAQEHDEGHGRDTRGNHGIALSANPAPAHANDKHGAGAGATGHGHGAATGGAQGVFPKLAVVGVLIVEGAPHAYVGQFWGEDLPKEKGQSRLVTTSRESGPKDFLPANPAYFRYSGSLTTPPCTQNVMWTVMGEPISFSSEQIDAFRSLKFLSGGQNKRPVQALQQRIVLKSRLVSGPVDLSRH